MSGIVIHRSHHAQEFVVIPNAVAQSTVLSFGAIGLHAYLLSLPPEWSTTTDRIAEDRRDSRTAVRKYMAELREAGYVVLVTERGKDGQIRQHLEVFDQPQTGRALPASGLTRHDAHRARPARVRSDQARRESSQVAPDAGIPAAGKPAAGKPAASIKNRTKTLSSLGRAAQQLAALGGTEREIQAVTGKITQDPAIRWPGAYLRRAIDQGDGPALLEEARQQLADADATARPPWCGQCDERTRQIELGDGTPSRCPACHPSASTAPGGAP